MEFAKWALGELNLPTKSLIIDPWNGSGTTGAACALLGISCQGYDLNPVMVHLGRARVASKINFEEAEEIIYAVGSIIGRDQSVNIDGVGKAFQELPVGNESAHSAAIASLFPYARKLLTLQRTKNPSWYKKNTVIDGISIDKDEFFRSWTTLLKELTFWQNLHDDPHGVLVSVERGDSRKSLGRRDSFDGFLTSPPYLTRLDYVQATLPEFLFLQKFDVVPSMQRLRRSMLGSPLTSERSARSLDRLPRRIRDLLLQIAMHSSKASGTYYHRFFSTYFVDLHVSMGNIEKVLKKGALGCIVVQPSHYKEIEIDLSNIVIMLARELGLNHCSTVTFNARRSMSSVNSRAHTDAREPKSEAAIFLRKG